MAINSISVDDSFLSAIPENHILAFSTYRSGSVLFLQADPAVGAIWFEKKLEIASGISTCGDTLSIGTIDSIENYSLKVLFDEFSREKESHFNNQQTINIALKPRSIISTGKILSHEIVATDKGTTYFVNTRYSAISAYHNGIISEKFWAPPFLTEWEPEDFCHLNGMAFFDGEPQVATCLATANFAYGWRLFPHNSGALMNIKTNSFLCTGLSVPHSPRCIGNLVYYLESGVSSLCTLCLTTGKTETLLKIPGFARGMAIKGKYAFIGTSIIRNSNLWNDLPVKLEFPNSLPGIVIVDLISRTIVSSMCLQGSIYEIFDVQLICQS